MILYKKEDFDLEESEMAMLRKEKRELKVKREIFPMEEMFN